MNENGDDRVVKLHREAVERRRAEQERRRALVEAMFDQAAERQREQEQRDQALIEHLHREILERDRPNLTPVAAPKGIHYTELPAANPGEPLADEWNTYRREVGRWLAEGQEGRHVVIKGHEVLGFFDTFDRAYETGFKQFPAEAFFVHPIRAEEPYLRIRGLNYPWPSSLSG